MSLTVRNAILAGTIATLVTAVNAAAALERTPGCVKAQRKVANEERWAVKVEASIERDRKAHEACATRPVCGRYESRIREMETRAARHAARLAKFRSDVARSCSAG